MAGDRAIKQRVTVPRAGVSALLQLLDRAAPVVPATLAQAQAILPVVGLLSRVAAGEADLVIENKDKPAP